MKLTSVTEYGKRFETGRPVCFRLLRNTERAPYFGSTYQQDIEPAGLYLIHNPTPGQLAPRWAVGECCFEHPLVIPINTSSNYMNYDETSWKANLRREYRAKGKALSAKLRRAGYDGIVTVTVWNGKPTDTREIVALAPKACRIERIAK